MKQTCGPTLRWDGAETLVLDLGPLRFIVAHLVDGEVNIYRWQRTDGGDEVTVKIPCTDLLDGGRILTALLLARGVVVPPYDNGLF